MRNGTLLVVALFVGMQVCVWSASSWSEWLALGLMICAGIPHGSFDLRVAEAKWREGVVSRQAIFSGYIVCVIAMSGLCVFAPPAGLSLFLLISAIHFAEGETHSGVRPDATRGYLFGVAAIILPIGLHPYEAQLYMSYFIPRSMLAGVETPLVIGSEVLALLLGAVLARDLLACRDGNNFDTIERIICLLGLILLPPLGGFAVWFIGRHSRQHLEVCKGMFLTSRAGVPLDFVLISLLAIAGLVPFTLLFDFSQIHQLFAASLCLIAGLTLPHMIVSHRIRDVATARVLPK